MHRRSFPCPFLLLLLFFAVTVHAQSAPSQASASESTAGKTLPEMTQHDEATTFKVNVKLVMVRVVVRDAKGRAIGNLQKQDFQLLDKGKPQIISHFEAMQPGSPSAVPKTAPETTGGVAPEDAAMHPLGTTPEQYIAYLFDDEHLELGNLNVVREAALRHMKTLQPTDRAAIFTTSGRTILDFTDDRTKLNDALLRLNPALAPIANNCPVISYYEADLIINKRNQEAIKLATQNYLECSMLANPMTSTNQKSSGPAVALAPHVIPAYAQTVLSNGDASSRRSLQAVDDVIKHLSVLPGQRNLVLVSPGFLTPNMSTVFNGVVDRAIRSQVVINAIDGRGLYVVPFGGTVEERTTLIDPDPGPANSTMNGSDVRPDPNAPKSTVWATNNPGLGGTEISQDPSVLKVQYDYASALEQAEILSSLSDQTGGLFVHNSNDFDSAFRRAGTPESSYLLAFSPQDMKPDGSFHPLKVTVNQKGLTVQARRGYFAANKAADPAEQAKAEMMDALFSQDQLNDIPVELHTQFFKASDDNARLTVLAHVDLKHLQFQKTNGRNDNVLTCDSALFNQNGNYLQGTQKVVTLHLKDETLTTKLGSGIVLKTSFDNVRPGSYMVRLVVRDQEGQMMSAQTDNVEIP